MKKAKKTSVLTIIALTASVLSVCLMIFAVSTTIGQIDDEMISKTPTAILASTGLRDGKTVSVPVTYFDQRGDECVDLYNLDVASELEARQFEWSKCEYYNEEIETGLVDYKLGKDYLPVGIKGNLTSNRGMGDLTRWFNEVEGKSKSYAGVLRMDYKAEGAEFSFYKSEFYPLDEAEFSAGDYMNGDGHNHLFTMNFAIPFSPLFSGDERIEITADDDTFVFMGNKLVIDMGGIHEASTGKIWITEDGEVYASVGDEELTYSGARLSNKDGAIMRIFHADRNSVSSVFNLVLSGMKLNITESKLASGDDGIQVAYDPNNPSYVAPLGESTVFQPDQTKGLLVIATIEAFAIVVLSILLMVVVRFFVKKSIVKG